MDNPTKIKRGFIALYSQLNSVYYLFIFKAYSCALDLYKQEKIFQLFVRLRAST